MWKNSRPLFCISEAPYDEQYQHFNPAHCMSSSHTVPPANRHWQHAFQVNNKWPAGHNFYKLWNSNLLSQKLYIMTAHSPYCSVCDSMHWHREWRAVTTVWHGLFINTIPASSTGSSWELQVWVVMAASLKCAWNQLSAISAASPPVTSRPLVLPGCWGPDKTPASLPLLLPFASCCPPTHNNSPALHTPIHPYPLYKVF